MGKAGIMRQGKVSLHSYLGVNFRLMEVAIPASFAFLCFC
jgi:hypothetical protein